MTVPPRQLASGLWLNGGARAVGIRYAQVIARGSTSDCGLAVVIPAASNRARQLDGAASSPATLAS